MGKLIHPDAYRGKDMKRFLQKQVGLSAPLANEVVEQLFEEIQRQLLKRRVVMLPKVGTFEFFEPSQRNFWNFQTGRVEFQACIGGLKFRAGSRFVREFNGINGGSHKAVR